VGLSTKLKEKIRNKLREYLGINTIWNFLVDHSNNNEKTFKLYDKEIEQLEKAFRNNSSLTKNNTEDINILHNTIRNVVSVGSDVCRDMGSDRSWAVVCIEGNYNIVKFIDLHGTDYRRILDFLKQYEGSRMVIDAPQFTYFEDAFKMK
jgi:hypothetical protein